MTAVKFLLKLRLEMSIEQQNNKTMTSWWLGYYYYTYS